MLFMSGILLMLKQSNILVKLYSFLRLCVK